MIKTAEIDLPQLLSQWYGPPVRDEVPLPDSCQWIPEPFRKWHEMASRWDARLTSVSQMLRPEKIEVADDGKAVS